MNKTKDLLKVVYKHALSIFFILGSKKRFWIPFLGLIVFVIGYIGFEWYSMTDLGDEIAPTTFGLLLAKEKAPLLFHTLFFAVVLGVPAWLIYHIYFEYRKAPPRGWRRWRKGE